MFENIIKFFKKAGKKESLNSSSKDTAKERLHLVLMQDRANVSADFLDLMRQEIIEVIKKYIDIDESAMDVRLTNQENEDGTQGAPALYANIPIVNIKEKARTAKKEVENDEQVKTEEKKVEEKVKTENITEKEDVENNTPEPEKDIDEETKEVEEKAKKIVKEENSSHNKEEHKKIEKEHTVHKITKNKEKKESENE